MELDKFQENHWTKQFAAWWFTNGGVFHGLWKSRQYKKIKELAMKLPRYAFEQGFKEGIAYSRKFQREKGTNVR